MGGHVAVAELVGDDQVGFRPQGEHRLIAAATLVMREGGLLVGFDDGSVLVDGGDGEALAVLFVARGDALHAAGLDLLQGLDREAAGDDEAELLLAGRAQVFQLLVVEQFEEGPQGRGLGGAVAETAFEAAVGGEQRGVFGAVAADGLEHDDRLDELSLAEAAVTAAQAEAGVDEVGEAEGTESAGSGEGAGMGAGSFVERSGIEFEGSLGQQRESDRIVLIICTI